jgi:hypothetical protein
MESGIAVIKQYPFASWPESFLWIAFRSFNRTSEHNAEFTFSPRFSKWANSTPLEPQNTVRMIFPADGVTLNSLVESELGCFHCTEVRFHSEWLCCTDESSQVTILLSILIFFSSSAYCKWCCKDTHSVNFISILQFCGQPLCALSKTSNDNALCCILNHGYTLVELLLCLSLSSCQLESTFPLAAQLVLS